jgi:two-component system OmpR family sensor kinase
MSRMPIRVRLTAAFALAMLVVLVGSGLFIYVRLMNDLDEHLDTGLRGRADAIAMLARDPGYTLPAADWTVLDEDEETFAQILAADGRVLHATPGVREPGLRPVDVRRALQGAVWIERTVAGVQGPVRVHARPVSGGGAPRVVAVGQSRDDRDEILAGLVTDFGVGGLIAVVVASLFGYALARSGLAPVEAMRRRAAAVSLSRADLGLPVPRAHDEVRRLAETLNDMLGRLRRSFERERRFVADASHELRTPIAVVKTELEGALRSGDCGPEVHQALVAAVEECDHLGQLAEDLLVLARSAEGQLPVHAEDVDALTLLADLRERFADRAAQRGRVIELDVQDGVRLRADVLRLRQALANLIDNALRHGGGTIALAARSPSPAVVELDVFDEGPGFGDDISARAFERFARGDRARARGGTGLGMAIVRAIAEAHGGEAAIVPGPGARVRITLPAPARPRLDHGPADATAPTPDGARIAGRGRAR